MAALAKFYSAIHLSLNFGKTMPHQTVPRYYKIVDTTNVKTGQSQTTTILARRKLPQRTVMTSVILPAVCAKRVSVSLRKSKTSSKGIIAPNFDAVATAVGMNKQMPLAYRY